MASVMKNDGKKWINSAIALGSVLLGYLTYRFTIQLGDWFDLEAKFAYFNGASQGLALLVGLSGFLVILKNSKAYTFLNDVYGELVKATWADKDSVVKLTIGIIITVAICSGLLVAVDLGIQKLLGLLY